MKVSRFLVTGFALLMVFGSIEAKAQTPHIEWSLESHMGKYRIDEEQPCTQFESSVWVRTNGVELRQSLANPGFIHSFTLGGIREGDRVVDVLTFANSHGSLVSAARPFEGVNNGKVEGRSSAVLGNVYVTHTIWDERSRVLEMVTEVYPEVDVNGHAKSFVQHRFQRIEFFPGQTGFIFTSGTDGKNASCQFRRVNR